MDQVRYERQERIPGWDQEKLTNARVVIIGTSNLGRYTALALAALGVGDLILLSAEPVYEVRFLDKLLSGDSALALRESLQQINPEIRITALRINIVNRASLSILGRPTVIVETTNNAVSKALVLQYCQQHSIPLVAGACCTDFGRLALDVCEPQYLISPDLQRSRQGTLVSMVLGGYAAELVKNILMAQEVPAQPIYYNLSSPERFSFQRGLSQPEQTTALQGKDILLIGAGALGTFIAIGMASLHVRSIIIMDPDQVEETNLNRQVLYYDAVGAFKAEALAQKIKVMAPQINVEALVQRFTAEQESIPCDLIMDGLDNIEDRIILSEYAVAHQIALISGGTGPSGGQTTLYVPGQTNTIIEKLQFDTSAPMRRGRCAHEPDPSVIMSNQIIGGMMVAEARCVLDGATYGLPLNHILRYRSNSGFGLNKIS